MARGQDTSKHPNRGVGKQAFMMTGADMEYLQNRVSTTKQSKKMPPCVNCGAGESEDCAPNCLAND